MMSSEKLKISSEQPEKEGVITDGASLGKAMISATRVEEELKTPDGELPEWKKYVDSLTDEQILNGDFDESKLSKTEKDFGVDPYNYLIFRHHEEKSKYQQRFDILPNIDEVCTKYVEYTRRLINELSGENRPDHIIYLDKSARPASWLVNLFWDDFASTDSNGEKAKRPEHSYLNIDRINVLRAHGIQLIGDYEVGTGLKTNEVFEREKDNFDNKIFSQIRGLYLKDGLKPEDDSPEKIMQMPTTLDGKTVTIVDEVMFTGTTMKIAKLFLEKAFPDTKFQTLFYWPGGLRKTDDGQEYMSSMPVWYPHYDASITTGRGVQDVDDSPEGYYAEKLHDFTDEEYLSKNTSFSEKSPEDKQVIIDTAERKYYPKKKAHNFVGVPLNPKLEQNKFYNSRELAAEMKQMHQDYVDGKILPSIDPKNLNNDDDYLRIVRAGINPRKFRDIRTKVFSRPRVE